MSTTTKEAAVGEKLLESKRGDWVSTLRKSSNWILRGRSSGGLAIGLSGMASQGVKSERTGTQLQHPWFWGERKTQRKTGPSRGFENPGEK